MRAARLARHVLLAAALVALGATFGGCFTKVTDPNRWRIGQGEYPQFSSDSDVCLHQASHPLQPELADAPLDEDTYRRCMEGFGWRER